MSKSVRIVGVVAALLLLNVSLLFSLNASGSPAPAAAAPPPTVVVHLYFNSPAERDRLANEWGAIEASTHGGYLTIWTDQAGYAQMQAQGLHAEIDAAATADANRPVPFGSTNPNPLSFSGGYKTVEEMQAFLDAEVAAHPGLAEKVDIGDSWCKVHAGTCTQPSPYNGYDMYALRITNQAIAGPKPAFWYDGAIHSREIAVPEVAMRYIDYLLTNYDTNADAHWLVDYHEIWVTPMVNPDGHHIVEAGPGSPYSQRKNADNQNGYTGWPPSGGSQFGTDLNRNAPFKWGCCGGSSGTASSLTYRGPSAGNEPEMQSLTAKIASVFPDQRGPNDTDPAPITTTGVMVTMHSYARLITSPWGWTDTVAPNGPDMLNIAAHMAAVNAGGSGYDYCHGTCPYAVDGATDDWTYGTLGVPAFTIELEGSSFFPSYAQMDSFFANNRGTLLYDAKIARTPLIATHGPDANTVALAPMTVTQGTPTHLSFTANYAWSNNTFSQNVGAAEYYVDTPPWAGGTAQPMSATDGNFNSPTEGAQADADTAGLSVGRHIIFVRGRGATDYAGFPTWGPISAVFLYVTDPPTATPTNTPLAPTSTTTNVPPTGTATSIPAPTNTPGGPTDTPLPPTATLAPTETATQLPSTATATPPPPTDTPSGATNTPSPTITPGGCTDIFEPDNNQATASILYISQSQQHTFCRSTGSPDNDDDWVKLVGISASTTYDFRTNNLGDNADTIIVLYDSGGNVLATNDDETPGSRNSLITYTSPTTQTLYLQVVNKSSIGGYGPGYAYTLGAAVSCATPFVDVAGNVFIVAINYLYCHGIVSGTDSTHYSPTATSTRAQFAKVVALGFSVPSYTPTGNPDFTDVPASYFAYPYIEAGYHAGILSGFDANSCGQAGATYPCYLPNRPITRAQLTKLVANAAGYTPYTPATQTFSDVGPSNVFYISIETAHYKGVINGYPDNTFRPNSNIRRDEMAQIVYKGITTP